VKNKSGFPVEAVWTGLEPATSGVTGRHSNQLNYQTLIIRWLWVVKRGAKIGDFFDLRKKNKQIFHSPINSSISHPASR
jgi:hypothetical protein